ncbi:DUF3368 domain-containing protein [Candidatus Thiodictyon syntrophicum]|jgi:predicted nucleic acid-binding protein|uniref:DUF3368 domain-containing protein n=1 Tax=Candidatus Thiodictyon syntrophicum TaxID=1166950 RepID=UPI000C2D1ABD|nr:DUF3368 domain-containing protein [Candidatus Thiodictyon syntrophicum]
MPDIVHSLVTNTTPLIALAVGVGNLDILRTLYDRVVVPLEVCEEIVGVLIKARQSGYDVSVPEAIERMREHGIWLSNEVVRYALAQQV